MSAESPNATGTWSDADPENDVASLLNERVIHSERLRAAALIAITAVFVLVIAALWMVPGLLPPGKEHAYRPALRIMAGVLVLMGVYESLVWMWLGRWQQAKRPVPSALRYVNAFVETAVPTLVIWDWADVAGPLQTVCGVLPYLYFPFIAASALHLNPRLCLFIGSVAGVSFTGIAFAIARGIVRTDSPLLISVTSFFLKGFMMLVCGAVAAFVAAQLKSHQRGEVRA